MTIKDPETMYESAAVVVPRRSQRLLTTGTSATLAGNEGSRLRRSLLSRSAVSPAVNVEDASSETASDSIFVDGYAPLKGSLIGRLDERRPQDPLLTFTADETTPHSELDASSCVFKWCKTAESSPVSGTFICGLGFRNKRIPWAPMPTMRLRYVRRVLPPSPLHLPRPCDHAGIVSTPICVSPQSTSPNLTSASGDRCLSPLQCCVETCDSSTLNRHDSLSPWSRQSSGFILPSPRVITYVNPLRLESLSPGAAARIAARPPPDPTPRIMTLNKYPSAVHPRSPGADLLRSTECISANFTRSVNLTRSTVSVSPPASCVSLQSTSPPADISVHETPNTPQYCIVRHKISDGVPCASGTYRFASKSSSSNVPVSTPKSRYPGTPSFIPGSSEVFYHSAKSKLPTPAFETPPRDMIDLLPHKTEVWNSMLDRVIEVCDDKDCRVGNDLLVNLQEDILNYVAELKIELRFVVESAVQNCPGLDTKKHGLIVDQKELGMLRQRLNPVKDVLAETGITFFKRFQPAGAKFAKGRSQAAEIEKFLKEVGTGPRGGRSEVGNPLREPRDMPVVVYGCAAADGRLQANLIPCPKVGPQKWSTMSKGACPIKVSVFFTCDKKKRSDKENFLLRDLQTILGRMLSDWRCHKLRLFDYNAMRYQAFLPVMSEVSSQDLAKQGWGEMEFNGDSVVRWKTLPGGMILAFIAGAAEASIDKVMSLVYDGDNHFKWIPFLTETKREFSLSRLEFIFSYSVSLPWPLNKREFTLHGMSTDSLLVSPIHAIQMWGTHVPEAATSVFGVPLPKRKSRGVTRMEVPVLSFSLTPLSQDNTYVRMVAVMDVKINFIPMAVQTYMAKHMATKMFGNVQKICKEFDTSEYKQVITENQAYFDELTQNVALAVTQQRK